MANAVQKAEPETNVPATVTPAAMIAQAVANGADVAIMEKLLALQERYDAFNARKAYDTAIADLRANLPDIVKSQEGYGYKYEDLADIVRQVSPVMSERGLSFTWDTDTQNGEVIVTCIITHKDGHSNKTRLAARPDTSGSKNAIQAIGSAVTYLQRYTLKAALGIAASKDDDGASAGGNTREQKASQQQKPSKDEEARAVYTAAEHDIRKAASKDELRRVWENIAWDAIPADWKRDLVKEKDERIAALDKPADDEFPGDFDLNGHFDRMNDAAA